MHKNSFILLALILSGCTQDVAELTPIKHIISEIEKTEVDGSLIPFEDPKNHLFGYKDKSGKIIIPAKFAMVHDFNQYGIANAILKSKLKKVRPSWVTSGRVWVKIDKSGKVFTQSYFFDNGPDYFVNGLSRFVEKGKIGFINHKAEKVIPAQFDWASAFTYDAPVAVVCNGCTEEKKPANEYPEVKAGKWGAIDSKGKIIVPLEYEVFHVKSRKGCLYKEKYVTLTFQKGKKLCQVFQTQNGDYKIVESSSSE